MTLKLYIKRQGGETGRVPGANREASAPRAPVELFATYEGVERAGRLLEVRAGALEKRLFAGLEFSF